MMFTNLILKWFLSKLHSDTLPQGSTFLIVSIVFNVKDINLKEKTFYKYFHVCTYPKFR